MDIDRYIRSWQKHIEMLAGEIGPRGSTRPEERAAAEYCQETMRQFGLDPAMEFFTSSASAYQLHIFVALFMLLSFAIYPLAGRISAVVAVLVGAVAVYSESMDLLFRDNPMRRLIAKGQSQNVFATSQPTGEHRQDMVVIGHLDTNRSGLIFSTNGWTDFFRAIVPVIFFSFVAQVVLYMLGAITQWPWIWPVSIVSAVMALLLLAICIESELSPYSPGANDNATGAGLVLTLAENLLQNPLQHTRVWFVNTGCEEVKHYGAIDFFERHAGDLVDPKVLVFEMLGCDGPAWLEHERIVPGFSYDADPALVALVKRLVDENEELTGHPTTVKGGHSEMADPLRIGIPAITFIGLGPNSAAARYDGPRIYWHQVEDTPDKINPDVLRRTYALTWAFINAIDRRAE